MQKVLTLASGVFLLLGLIVHTLSAGGVSRALALFGGHGGEAVPWQEAADLRARDRMRGALRDRQGVLRGEAYCARTSTC
ncbi:MAG: hypothetical protein U5K43_07160 [Halofilum sp. (in: g-proteobacteria)]|nr:hypothetical protein [Halofilum sp. (in: g-proteobacteria)]